nr:terpene synthase [Radula lindenbergiana]
MIDIVSGKRLRSKMASVAVAYPAQKQMSEEEIQRIKSINLPEPKAPYPPKKNKHSKKALAEAHEWVRSPALCKMYRTQKVMDAHTGDAFDLVGLALEVFDEVKEKAAIYSGKFILWTFAIDDYIDGGATFDDPTKSAALIWELCAIVMWSFPDDPRLRENFAKVVSSGDAAGRDAAFAYMDRTLADARLKPGTFYDTSSAETSPFCKALGELWITIAESSPRHYALRHGIALQRYVLSHLTEITSRNTKVILLLDEYIDMRRQTVAMEPFLLVNEFLTDSYLPNEVFYTTEMQRFLGTSNDVVAWLNDIASFKKEILQGDMCNLIGVISHEQNCTFEEAAERAFRMTMDRIGDFDNDVKALEAVTHPEHQIAVKNYIAVGKNWIWRSYEWNCKTRHYNFDI